MKWRYDEKAQASIFSITGTWTVDWEKDGSGRGRWRYQAIAE